MEDLHTIKNHYAYMLRVELPHTDKSELILDKWMDNFGCSSFLFGRELGEKLGKEHYQGIVWFEHKLSTNEMNARRNWFRGKCRKGYGYAFTSARKVTTLASYSAKDADLYTNLTQELISTIPSWKTKSQQKTLNKALLREKLEKGNYKNYYLFLDGLLKHYRYIYKNYPTKRTIHFWALEFGMITKSDYLKYIGVLQDSTQHRESHHTPADFEYCLMDSRYRSALIIQKNFKLSTIYKNFKKRTNYIQFVHCSSYKNEKI